MEFEKIRNGLRTIQMFEVNTLQISERGKIHSSFYQFGHNNLQIYFHFYMHSVVESESSVTKNK